MTREENYMMKAEALKVVINTIPDHVQRRLKHSVITSPNYEPVVLIEVQYKRVDIDDLHCALVYDLERDKWLSTLDLPENEDKGRYVAYAPVEWELLPFLLVRMDATLAALNKRSVQPDMDRINTVVMLGDWSKPQKSDNLIAIGCFLGSEWYAQLSLDFEQTTDPGKAVFYYDWTDHEYRMMDGRDVSDPCKYTLFAVANYCKYAPQNLHLDDFLFVLNRSKSEVPLKISYPQCSTSLMTAAEFDTQFPGVRKMMKEGERHE